MIDELKQKIIALIESKFQDLTVENIVLDSVGRNKYSDIYFISVLTKDIKLKIVAKIKKPTSPLHKIRGEYDSYMDLSDILKKSPYRTLDVIGYTECPNSLFSIFAEGEIL